MPADSKAKFPRTRWSLVVEARDQEQSGLAFEELCQLYWPPLYACIRRSGWGREDAEDLCQEFLFRLIDRRHLDRADAEKGRLRSYILAHLKHFLSDQRRAVNAKKRGGDREIISIDHAEAESRYLAELTHDDTPEQAFEKTWALTLLDAVLGRLGSDYADEGKSELFEALKHTLQWAGSADSLREIGQKLDMQEGTVKVAAHRLRKRYRAALRNEVKQTLAEGESVEKEMRSLFEVLGG